MKRVKSIVANAKIVIPFFIHLHIVIMRDVEKYYENVRSIIKSRKTSVFLNRC